HRAGPPGSSGRDPADRALSATRRRAARASSPPRSTESGSYPMSAFQPFGATNAPDTCKWCGRKLHPKYKTAWTYHEATHCKHCGSTNLKQASSNATTQYDKHYECQDC